MTTDTQNQPHVTKLVVALLDGRRLKGYAFNFTPLLREHFNLFPQDLSLGQQGIRVELKDVKAVFFVKDFAGNPAYTEPQPAETNEARQHMEITFTDGEKIVGKTVGYDSKKIGFFMVPVDPNSNNLRIFIVNKNVSQVRHRFRSISPAFTRI